MEQDTNQYDILRKIEKLTADMDSMMHKRSEAVLRRYPLMFGFLVLFGAVALGEGIKELIKSVHVFEEYPLLLLVLGIVILTITGTLYKKLDK